MSTVYLDFEILSFTPLKLREAKLAQIMAFTKAISVFGLDYWMLFRSTTWASLIRSVVIRRKGVCASCGIEDRSFWFEYHPKSRSWWAEDAFRTKNRPWSYRRKMGFDTEGHGGYLRRGIRQQPQIYNHPRAVTADRRLHCSPCPPCSPWRRYFSAWKMTKWEHQPYPQLGSSDYCTAYNEVRTTLSCCDSWPLTRRVTSTYWTFLWHPWKPKRLLYSVTSAPGIDWKSHALGNEVDASKLIMWMLSESMWVIRANNHWPLLTLEELLRNSRIAQLIRNRGPENAGVVLRRMREESVNAGVLWVPIIYKPICNMSVTSALHQSSIMPLRISHKSLGVTTANAKADTKRRQINDQNNSSHKRQKMHPPYVLASPLDAWTHLRPKVLQQKSYASGCITKPKITCTYGKPKLSWGQGGRLTWNRWPDSWRSTGCAA